MICRQLELLWFLLIDDAVSVDHKQLMANPASKPPLDDIDKYPVPNFHIPIRYMNRLTYQAIY